MMKDKNNFIPGDLVEFSSDDFSGYGIIEETRSYYDKPYCVLVLAFTIKKSEQSPQRIMMADSQLKLPSQSILNQFKHVKSILIFSNHLVNASTFFLSSVVQSNLKADISILKQISSDVRNLKKLFKES